MKRVGKRFNRVKKKTLAAINDHHAHMSVVIQTFNETNDAQNDWGDSIHHWVDRELRRINHVKS